ncbi:N-acetylmuramoyl-L-alanine amidase family 2 [Actinobacteria bacterium OV450]|nr:N-acetylmuramoyl-L-alanine amidase family 2 [Actinobacteria bacterium OV450]
MSRLCAGLALGLLAVCVAPVAASSPDPCRPQCRFLAADPNNYQLAHRPADGLVLDRIVIGNSGTTYGAALADYQNPSLESSVNYVVRSADGQVTEMVRPSGIPFFTDNYSYNLHAVGIEVEGTAEQGATWYTPSAYRSVAALTRRVSARYGVPADQQHVIGEDQVPAESPGDIAGMGWGPGPYWDWQRLMAMVPPKDAHPSARSTTAGRVPRPGSVLTIAPDFATNVQTLRVCASAAPQSCTLRTQPSNFLFARTGPRDSAPLFADPGLPAGIAGTDRIEDWGARLRQGMQFVVADQQDDWTAIWFCGRKVWFLNPGGTHTRTDGGRRLIVRPKPGRTSIPVYGSNYPEAGAYPPGQTPTAQVPLGVYTIPEGQSYVATAPATPAQDFSTDPPDTVITGADRYISVQFNHRLAWLKSTDVEVVRR